MESTTAVLERALAWFESLDITVERVVTDNGSVDKSHPFRNALAAHGIKCTRPYTPCTNGEAERFIQMSLREWLYAKPFDRSEQRTATMRPWLHDYNSRRPHSAS